MRILHLLVYTKSEGIAIYSYTIEVPSKSFFFLVCKAAFYLQSHSQLRDFNVLPDTSARNFLNI